MNLHCKCLGKQNSNLKKGLELAEGRGMKCLRIQKITWIRLEIG